MSPDLKTAMYVAAGELLSVIKQAKGVAVREEQVAVTSAGWVIHVAAVRNDGEYTRVEMDILEVMVSCPRRWPASRILAELASRGMIHGDITVKRALARMVKAGLLCNSKLAPRGYSLPANETPLFPSEMSYLPRNSGG